MAKVGFFLLCWGWLEAALDRSILDLGNDKNALGGKTAGKKIEQWRERSKQKFLGTQFEEKAERLATEAMRLKAVRNLLAHGMVAVDEDQPSGALILRCRDVPTQELISFNMAELEKLLQAMDRCRIQIAGLTRQR